MAPQFWAKFSDNIVLNASLRYAMLRIVFVLTAILLVVELVGKVYGIKNIVVIVLIFVHHLASALGFNYLPGVIDLGVIFAEAALPFHVAIRLSPHAYLLGASLKWIISLFLLLHALLRVEDVRLSLDSTRRPSLWQTLKWTKYDITGLGAIANANDSRHPKLDILMGRSLLRKQFTGEKKWIAIFRGGFAWMMITAIAMFGLYNIVVEPIWVIGVIPLKTFRSPTVALPTDFFGSVPTVWNVVVAIPKHLIREKDPDFSSSVNVTPLWDDWNKDDNTLRPPCGLAPDKTFQIQKPKSNETWDIITFHCPSRVSIPKDKILLFNLPAPHHDTRPNLLVTVNFTALNISSPSLQNIRGNSVQVSLGLTNNTFDVVNRTLPTTLLPGVNIVGAANLFIFQRFRNAHISVFGLFDSFESFQVSEISHISPDPLASTSTSITPSPNVSTMRIFLQNDFTDWRITQDSQEKSVLKGFSVVGGLWAFFGGIFAALFGKSIMQMLFGSKPITLFGPMAAFQRDKIREFYKDEYPYIFDKTKTIEDNHDLVRFIAEEVIDFKIFGDMPTVTRRLGATWNETIALVHPMGGEPQYPVHPMGGEPQYPVHPMGGEPQYPGPSQATSSRNPGQSWESEFNPYAYEIR